MTTEALTTIEEQLEVLLGELEAGPGSSKDKVQYAVTVTKNLLVYIDDQFPESFEDLHLDEEDSEHCEEGWV